MAWRVMMPRDLTWSAGHAVGEKCKVIRCTQACRACADLGMLVGAGSYRVRCAVQRRVGGGDLLQEPQELLVAVPRVAGVRGDLPGGDLQRGEQGGGAVALVVMGPPGRQARAAAAASTRSGPAPGAGLFSSTLDHDRVVGRRRYTPDGVPDLRLQLRLGAERERLDPVRREAPTCASPGHRWRRRSPARPPGTGPTARDAQPVRRPPAVRQRRHLDVDLVDLRRPATGAHPPVPRSRPARTGPASRSP